MAPASSAAATVGARQAQGGHEADQQSRRPADTASAKAATRQPKPRSTTSALPLGREGDDRLREPAGEQEAAGTAERARAVRLSVRCCRTRRRRPSAERQPHGRLATPGLRAREQEVGHVGAGDQQDEHDERAEDRRSACASPAVHERDSRVRPDRTPKVACCFGCGDEAASRGGRTASTGRPAAGRRLAPVSGRATSCSHQRRSVVSIDSDANCGQCRDPVAGMYRSVHRPGCMPKNVARCHARRWCTTGR